MIATATLPLFGSTAIKLSLLLLFGYVHCDSAYPASLSDFDPAHFHVKQVTNAESCTFAAADLTRSFLFLFCDDDAGGLMVRFNLETLAQISADPVATSHTVPFRGVVDEATGDFYVVGMTNQAIGAGSLVGEYDGFLMKYSHDGTRLWTVTYGSTAYDCGYTAALDSENGGVYVTGWYQSSQSGSHTGGNLNGYPFAARFSTEDGAQTWLISLNSAGFGNGYAQGIAYAKGYAYSVGYSGGLYVSKHNNETGVVEADMRPGLGELRAIKYDSFADKLLCIGYITSGTLDGHMAGSNVRRPTVFYASLDDLTRSDTYVEDNNAGWHEFNNGAIHPLSGSYILGGYVQKEVFFPFKGGENDFQFVRMNSASTNAQWGFQSGSTGREWVYFMSYISYNNSYMLVSSMMYQSKGAVGIYDVNRGTPSEPVAPTSTATNNGNSIANNPKTSDATGNGNFNLLTNQESLEILTTLVSASQTAGNTKISLRSGTATSSSFFGSPIFVIVIVVTVTVSVLICGSAFILRSRLANNAVVAKSSYNNTNTANTTTVGQTTSTSMSQSWVPNFGKTSMTTSYENNATSVATYHEVAVPGFLEKRFGVEFVPLRQIGKGGDTTIHLCQPNDPELANRARGVDLAVKVSKTSTQLMPDKLRKAFFQEVSLMWRFRDHPAFLKVYAFSVEPAALVVRFYPLGDFAGFIAAKGRGSGGAADHFVYSKLQLIGIFKMICGGIAYMHHNDISHSDIKPANFLLDVAPRMPGKLLPIISDLGISRVLNVRDMAVKEFEVANVNGLSLFFAAPELIHLFRARVSLPNPMMFKATDVYAIGLSLATDMTRRMTF